MKNKILTGILICSLGITACSDWLNVEPKTTVKEKELFSREIGFKEALTGIYIQMGASGLYGRNLSYGFLDILGQCYQPKDGSGNFYYQNKAYYEFPSDKTESATNAVWAGMYGVIANVNNLLYWIDRKKDVFTTDGYYEIIKGEALGLRAFLHFDLLRMFGPVYKQNPDGLSICYRSSFDRNSRKILPASAVVDSVLMDLHAAEEMLTGKDPLNFNFPKTINDEMGYSGDGFLTMRHKRMNLFAVKALLARVNMWVNNKSEAAKYASDVVGSGYFELISDNSVDRIFSSELLFSLYIDAFDQQVKNDFSWRGVWYIFEAEFLNEYFDVRVDGSNDIRYREGTGFIHDASGQFVQKYNQEGLWNSLENTVPLIRLPEMYYILAECTKEDEEAADYLNKVREARGIEAVSFGNESKEEALEKEYRKEFYAEGQLFFFYKRWFKPTFLHCPVREMKENNYQFSIPDDEVLFGDVPQ